MATLITFCKFYKQDTYNVGVFNANSPPQSPEWYGQKLLASPACLDAAVKIIIGLGSVRIDKKSYKSVKGAIVAINRLVAK